MSLTDTEIDTPKHTPPLEVQRQLVKNKCKYAGETLYWLTLLLSDIVLGDLANSVWTAARISWRGAIVLLIVSLIPRRRAPARFDDEDTNRLQNAKNTSLISSASRAWKQGIFQRSVNILPNTLRHCASRVFISARAITSFEQDKVSKSFTLITWQWFGPSNHHYTPLLVESCSSCLLEISLISSRILFKDAVNATTTPKAYTKAYAVSHYIKVSFAAIGVSGETSVSYLFLWVLQVFLASTY